MNVFLISDFNAEAAGRYIGADRSTPACDVKVAPYGQVFQTLASSPPFGRDSVSFVWTRPEGVIREYAQLLGGEVVDADQMLREVDAFAEAIKRFARQTKLVLVASWVNSKNGRGLGMLEWGVHGRAFHLAQMNVRLATSLAEAGGIYVLDAARWIEEAGASSRPPKHWFAMKCPFSEEVSQAAARDVKAAIRASIGQTRKIVMVDLDDTLWGGIVGDDGWQNIRLGGHDHVGEAYVEFQRALKELTRRGIQIAIVSKNEEATALEAIDCHPEMVLRRDDLAGWRINWNDKAQNIVDLVADLNLGLTAVVFIDDNPAERARVRDALPDVLVPEWPKSPVSYADALRALDCFEQAAITEEDRRRTRMYVVDRQRQEASATFESLDEWQASLDVRIDISSIDESNIKRSLQLINKTNQMTLKTRRVTEAEFRSWLAADEDRAAFAVTVSDRFGDLGLTGVCSWQRSGENLEIVDFVLSCRAMGRKVEEAIVHFVTTVAKRLQAKVVVARAIPTARNAPCLAFWQRSGFRETEKHAFVHLVSDGYAMPLGITLNSHVTADANQHSLRDVG